jgi:hypothetical protein
MEERRLVRDEEERVGGGGEGISVDVTFIS